METSDDKSEGKTSIHRPKTMFTKYLANFGLCCYSTSSDFC